MKASHNKNKYSLIDDTIENNINAQKELDNVIKNTIEEIKKINKKYPYVGIGDTATDEAIAEEFYNKLHWEN